MKQKIYLVLAGLFLLTVQLKAQAPQALNYQGVARDVSGALIPNQSIGLQFTIVQGTSTGTVVYQETQTATTNEFGLFAVAIGTGNVVSGNFSNIVWGGNTEFLEVGMDPTGGSNYTKMGTQQLLSVPYALYAASSGSGGGGSVTSVSANSPISVTTPTTTPALSLIGTSGTILYGTGTASDFNALGSTGQILQSNGTGIPTWVNANTTLTTSNIVVGDGSSVVVTNGNNQVVGASNVTLDVQGNAGGVFYGTGAGTSAAFTPAGSAGQVLESNGAGVPTWVTPSGGGGSANAWNLTGNNISTNSGDNFLGTTNQTPIEFEVSSAYTGAFDPTDANVYIGGYINGAPAGDFQTGVTANYTGGYNSVGIGAGALGALAPASTGPGQNYDEVAIGYGALLAFNPNGSQYLSSTAVGGIALRYASTGTPNEAFGYATLYNNSTGSDNVAVGYQTLFNNNANYNTGIGDYGLYNNYSGASNTSVGYYSLFNNQVSQNVAIGDSALASNYYGTHNTALGYQSLTGNQYATDNTALGYQSLFNNDNDGDGSGEFNVAVGSQSFYSNEDGNQSVAVGYEALYSNSFGINNTAVGYQALYNNNNDGDVYGSGWYNTAIGNVAMAANTDGQWNTAVGQNALFQNTTGDKNDAFGASLQSNTTGSFNVAFGQDALDNSNTNYNTAVGVQSSDALSSGGNNTSVGYNSLVTNITGSNNTALGYQADISADGIANATAVGANAVVNASNTVQLGSGASIQFDQALMPFNGSIYDPGTAGYVLQSNGAGTAPTWVSAPAAGAPALTQNQIAYGNASNIMTSSSNWTYDGTNVSLHAGNFAIDNAQGIYLNGIGDGNWTIARNTGNGEFVTSSSLTLTHAGGPGEGMTIQNNGGGVEFEILGGTGAITFDKAYTFPTTDGTNGQVLTTDGSGDVSWSTASGGSSANAWNLTGNAGTTAGTNFIGTTDGNDLVFKTNSAENMRITQGGNVGIGTPTPGATNELDVETGRSVAGYFATDSAGADVMGVVGTTNAGDENGIGGVFSSQNTGSENIAQGSTAGYGYTGSFSVGASSAAAFPVGSYGLGLADNGNPIGAYGDGADEGSGLAIGVFGQGSSSTGVGIGLYAEGSPIGGYAFSAGTGFEDANLGLFPTVTLVAGFDGEVTSGSGTNTTEENAGVLGVSTNPDGTDFNEGVFGYASGNTVSGNVGVFGVAAPSTGAVSYGIYGEGISSNGVSVGTYGVAQDTGSGTTYGAYGFGSSATGVAYGLYAEGSSIGGYGFGYGNGVTNLDQGATYGTQSFIAGFDGEVTGGSGSNITDRNIGSLGVATNPDGSYNMGSFSYSTGASVNIYGSYSSAQSIFTNNYTIGVYGEANPDSGTSVDGDYGGYLSATTTNGASYGVSGNATDNGAGTAIGSSAEGTSVSGLAYGSSNIAFSTNSQEYGSASEAVDDGSGTAFGVLGIGSSLTGVGYGLYGIGAPIGGYAFASGTGIVDTNLNAAGYGTTTFVDGFDGEVTGAAGSDNTVLNSGLVGAATNPDAEQNMGGFGFATEGSGWNMGLYGVAQTNSSTDYFTYGVYGQANPNGGASEFGDVGGYFTSSTTNGSPFGVTGVSNDGGSGTAVGVYGNATSTTGVAYGLYGVGSPVGGYAYAQGTGVIDPNLNTAGSFISGFTFVNGLEGEVTGTSGSNNTFFNSGVYGVATNPDAIQNTGIFGYGYGAVNNNYGVYAAAQTTGTNDYTISLYSDADPNGGSSLVGDYAGYFQGDVNVTGTLTAGDKLFKIDDPLDPANKYLYHDCVESPDMMNIYNGNVTTDADGNATVAMPQYFQAENKDFKYQLTVIGQFAQAIVATEISDNQFTIKTDKPNVKVSWQVTGVRNDPYANDHRVVAEVEKKSIEKGHYLYPQGYGQSQTLSIASLVSASNNNRSLTSVAHTMHNPILQQKDMMTEATAQGKTNVAPNTSKAHNTAALPKAQQDALKSLPTKQEINKTKAAVMAQAKPNANKTAPKAIHNPVTLSKGLSMDKSKTVANGKKVNNPIAAPKAPKIVGSASAAQLQSAPANVSTGTQVTPATNVNTGTQQAH